MDLAAIGRQFGLDEQQTQAAFDALAPVVAAGVRRNTQSDGGLADLLGALAGGSHARYVDEPDVLTSPDTINEGNAILGHVFGSKDVSRGVAQQLSATSGIGESVLKKLLPIIAAMVMGQIAKSATGGSSRGSSCAAAGWETFSAACWAAAPAASSQGGGSGGGLGDILGGILGGAMKQGGGSGGGGLGDILGGMLGGGQPAEEQPERPVTRRAPPQESPQGGGLEDILRDVLGGGGEPAPDREERVTRTRRGLDDMLGGGTSRGTAADDLLRSVEQLTRRR